MQVGSLGTGNGEPDDPGSWNVSVSSVLPDLGELRGNGATNVEETGEAPDPHGHDGKSKSRMSTLLHPRRLGSETVLFRPGRRRANDGFRKGALHPRRKVAAE